MWSEVSADKPATPPLDTAPRIGGPSPSPSKPASQMGGHLTDPSTDSMFDPSFCIRGVLPPKAGCSVRAGWAAGRTQATREHAAGCLYWLARMEGGASAAVVAGAVPRLAQLLRDMVGGTAVASAGANADGVPQSKARSGAGLPAAQERAAGSAVGALRALTSACNAAKAALGAEAGLTPLLQRLADGGGKQRLRADTRAILAAAARSIPGNLGALRESSKALKEEGVAGYHTTLGPMHF
ncbi:hypothetical protein WJX81_004440 [Elliptochloris bilobata]|uniref:Uncharacterized protein n=1 Tax=Elliptochloris bilobata TaxID=381761 RepID=A0AAW1S5I8_9CHLO